MRISADLGPNGNIHMFTALTLQRSFLVTKMFLAARSLCIKPLLAR